MVRAVVLSLVFMSAGASASAQSWLPLSSDVFTSAVSVGASARQTVRDIHQGTAGMSLGAALAFGGFDGGDWFLVVGAEGTTALARRIPTSDRLHGNLVGGVRINDDGGLLWIGAGGTWWPSAEAPASTGEVSAGLRLRLPEWLPERAPLLVTEWARDLSRYRTHFLRTGLRTDLKVTPEFGFVVDLGHSWSGLPNGAATGSVPFSSQGFDVMLTVTRQWAPTARSVLQGLSVEPYLRWTPGGRNLGASSLNGGVRAVVVR